MAIELAQRYEQISPKAYEHPADRAATSALHAIPLLDQVIKRFTDLNHERRLRQIIIGNSVRIGEDQVPDAWKSYVACASILDLPVVPNLYVVNDPGVTVRGEEGDEATADTADAGVSERPTMSAAASAMALHEAAPRTRSDRFPPAVTDRLADHRPSPSATMRTCAWTSSPGASRAAARIRSSIASRPGHSRGASHTNQSELVDAAATRDARTTPTPTPIHEGLRLRAIVGASARTVHTGNPARRTTARGAAISGADTNP